MAVEGVPLYIGGGEAEHSAEMLRMQNFFHFRGQEGWLTSTAGAVSQLDTPGTGVQLAPGPFLINSRFAGGAMQAYMGRILQSTEVDTTNVPPGAPRSDLVIMNIEDPYPSDGTDWPYPGVPGSSARQVGPYINIRVIDDVPANLLSIDDLPTARPERGYTAIAACRIDRPANTGTITNDMIVPLRAIINPWAGIQLPQAILDNLADLDTAVSEIGEDVEGLLKQKIPVPAAVIDAATCSYPQSQNTVYPNVITWTKWPKESDNNIIIPPWATHMRFKFEVIGALCKTSGTVDRVDANVYMSMQVVVGHASSDGSILEFIEPTDVYYGPCGDVRYNRAPFFCNPEVAGRLTIDSRDIGKVVNWHTNVKMLSYDASRCCVQFHQGVIAAVPGNTELFFEFEFLEGDSVQ
jgi:hypothetical protein